MTVARELLGKRLARDVEGSFLSGMICETEAYLGEVDSASHAFRGKTMRNAVLYGEPGRAYVYFIYGTYNMLNVVTGAPGVPWAVLIRALVPLTGIETMRRLRGTEKKLTDGPGKLCAALAIDRHLNGWDLLQGERLWIEPFHDAGDEQVKRTPRIGIDYAAPGDRRAPYRFFIRKEFLPGLREPDLPGGFSVRRH